MELLCACEFDYDSHEGSYSERLTVLTPCVAPDSAVVEYVHRAKEACKEDEDELDNEEKKPGD